MPWPAPITCSCQLHVPNPHAHTPTPWIRGKIKARGPTMITFRMTADVGDDRRVVLTLPPEVPTGAAELVVTVDPHDGQREQTRAAAVQQFMALVRSSSFCSAGPYPTREALHDRD